ncbi:NAD-dependent epimerase/dehydratase family protein [bacterium]|nr:NAD-dependent epimerase/dehydratase family protein [bacterium]
MLGFIGFHLAKHLIELGHNVIGLDNINDYYDVNLKFARLEQLGISRDNASKFDDLHKSNLYDKQFQFIRLNLEDIELLSNLFKTQKFDVVLRYNLHESKTNKNKPNSIPSISCVK